MEKTKNNKLVNIINMIHTIYTIIQYILVKRVLKKAGHLKNDPIKNIKRLGDHIKYAPSLMGSALYACIGGSILDKDMIFVDDLFMKSSKNTKKFIILHERGHQVAGHLKEKYHLRVIMNAIRPLPLPLNPATKREFEADENALKYMSKEEVISALKEMNKNIPLLNSKIEFWFRIKNIEKKEVVA